VSPTGQPDRLIWWGNSNGLFSVKSAYHLCKELESRASGESSISSLSSKVWKQLWRLQVPGVVRSFLWRVCTNSLPTRENLFKRGIVQDPLCPLCGLFPETTEHTLWSCESAVAVWMECPKRIQKLSLSATTGYHLVEQFMEVLDGVDLELVSSLARRIWLRRNSFIFEGKFQSPVQLYQQGVSSLSEFREAVSSSDSQGSVSSCLLGSFGRNLQGGWLRQIGMRQWISRYNGWVWV
jgi:hypothetical protein